MESPRQKIWIMLEQIPRGKVTTYKLLAEKIGAHPREVGRMLSSNPRPVIVPCHRVVRSDGTVGGYIFGEKKKIELLEKEGVKIMKGKIDLTKSLFGF